MQIVGIVVRQPLRIKRGVGNSTGRTVVRPLRTAYVLPTSLWDRETAQLPLSRPCGGVLIATTTTATRGTDSLFPHGNGTG